MTLHFINAVRIKRRRLFFASITMLPLYLGIVLAVAARIQAHKQVECFEVSSYSSGIMTIQSRCTPY